MIICVGIFRVPYVVLYLGAGGVSGPAAAQWQAALKSYLVQSGGETDMSKLGGVKKPEGIPKGQKLKAFLQQHPDVFTLDGNSVALKKK